MIYVTHDQVEAMTLADKIVVLKDGAIQQIGSPVDLYEKPANLFVAQFLGSPKMNVFTAEATDGAVRFAGSGKIEIADVSPATAMLGVRPENMQIAAAGQGNIDAKVDVVERLGSDTYVYLSLGHGDLVTVRLPGNACFSVGDTVSLRLDAAALHLFDADGRTLSS
jgi:multiple sugar transport system ATP-binding protein